MDYVSWLRELEKDAENLELLSLMIADITPEHDTKLQTLFDVVRKKQLYPINPNNRKLIIFTAFSDTADYLFANVSTFVKKEFGIETAEITGSVDGRTTLPRMRADLNTVLTCFSPVSKGRAVLMPGSADELDILIATDCISEGQNLQDCDYLINYDIHWNPVRIIQRFGRIDRIGSKNSKIQLVNFWPDMDLDEYINLKSRVETRMKISVMTSTGDDDLINPEEKGDLEYRKAQLKRLQEEVVDIEEMSSGISIMDLGLNEFRLDLLEYMKQHDDVESAPNGMHAVVSASDDAPAGVIFVLRNINDSVNIDNRNRIHPFYMVYITEEGEIVCDYLNPKKMLDTIRLLCRGKDTPEMALCKCFNAETDDGRNMSEISELLSESINSIIDVKEENDIDSLFKAGGTSALMSAVSGLDDFELICFLVVKNNTDRLFEDKEKFRVVIAGSRNFDNYEIMAAELDKYLKGKEDITIISGTAKGADQMGERYAFEHGLKVERFPAEWGIYHKGAGPIRNKEMVRNANAVIAFWDGESSGTKNIIECAKAENIPCIVISV